MSDYLFVAGLIVGLIGVVTGSVWVLILAPFLLAASVGFESR